MFTDGDLRKKLTEQGADVLEKKLSDIMCAQPRTVTPGMKAVDAMSAMEKPTPVTFLPVVENGVLQGIVTLHTLVSAGL